MPISAASPEDKPQSYASTQRDINLTFRSLNDYIKHNYSGLSSPAAHNNGKQSLDTAEVQSDSLAVGESSSTAAYCLPSPFSISGDASEAEETWSLISNQCGYHENDTSELQGIGGKWTLRRIALDLSLYLNLFITFVKLIAYLHTYSLSVLAALLDSVLDVVPSLY